MQKKFYLLICLVFGFINFGIAQNEKHIIEFEAKINQFRYGLYPELMKIPDEEIRQMNFQKDGKIVQQIEKFIQNHQKEIEQYQKARLQVFAKNKIDTTVFELDSIFDFGDLNSEDLLKLVTFQPLLKLNFLNPAEGVSIYVNMLLPRKLSVSELSPLFTRNAIARPLVFAKKLTENRWQIYLDMYRYLFEFEYSLKEIHIKPLKVYRRKL